VDVVKRKRNGQEEERTVKRRKKRFMYQGGTRSRARSGVCTPRTTTYYITDTPNGKETWILTEHIHTEKFDITR